LAAECSAGGAIECCSSVTQRFVAQNHAVGSNSESRAVLVSNPHRSKAPTRPCRSRRGITVFRLNLRALGAGSLPGLDATEHIFGSQPELSNEGACFRDSSQDFSLAGLLDEAVKFGFAGDEWSLVGHKSSFKLPSGTAILCLFTMRQKVSSELSNSFHPVVH
jgi:hypothetical protein